MPTVKGMRVERITCDEEERTREGYELELHYRLASGPDGRTVQEKAVAVTAGGQELLVLSYGPQASIWRVNRGWRRSDQRGFSMDSKTGFWVRRPGDEDRKGDIDAARLINGVLPFVRDTRNILLVRPSLAAVAKEDAERFLASLCYALQRGSQLLFQVEERELSVTRIGEHDERRIMFWEAAEGGSGVCSRLMEDQAAVSQVATEALKLCHFDVETGDDLAEKEKCSRACYRCLLSYANQPDHRLLNRFLIRDFLLQLRQAVTTRQAGGRSYEDHYQWLKERIDPNSSLEAQFLESLFNSHRRLPDRTQFRPEPDVFAEADFYYDRDGLKGIAVFVDGPHHDEPTQREKDQRERKKLEDLGYRVIAIRYDQPMLDQIQAYADILGPGV